MIVSTGWSRRLGTARKKGNGAGEISEFGGNDKKAYQKGKGDGVFLGARL